MNYIITHEISIFKSYNLKNQQQLLINHWLWLTHEIGCPDIRLHTYSDSKA